MDYIHIDFTYPLKLVWRIWQSIHIRRQDVRISPLALWNGNTHFGGHNVIHSGAVVGHSNIGRYTYINEQCYLPFCRIGSFCSIASHVKIIGYRHPRKTFVSTSPVFYSTQKQCGTTFVQENLFEEQQLIEGHSAIIGHDVWIGNEARIIEGVRIGNGAIVAAGAIVTKDVPSYAVVGGVPAKVIRYRFTEEQIKQLEQSQWWEQDEEWLKSHASAFCDIERFTKEVTP